MMRSYDIDGVLSVGIKPQAPFIIVSGRLGHFAAETQSQMRELGISPMIPVYLRPSGHPLDRIHAAIWKATIINFAGVDEHWEDDVLQMEIILSMTRAHVHLVESKNMKAISTLSDHFIGTYG